MQASVDKRGFSKLDIMSNLADFLNINLKSHKRKKYRDNLEYRVKTFSLKHNHILINYLSNYPLFSSKYLNYQD
jgi:hypothetical protein